METPSAPPRSIDDKATGEMNKNNRRNIRRPDLERPIAFKKALMSRAGVLACSVSGALFSISNAFAQSSTQATETSLFAALDPLLVGGIGAGALTAAAIAWAVRVSNASQRASLDWSNRLAEMETRLEKSEAVLSAHRGLVIVWDEDEDAVESGWGTPRILGSPAALATLMSFARDASPGAPPADRLLNTFAGLDLIETGNSDEARSLRDHVQELRAHGMSFSGAVFTSEGRAVEADGCVIGGQVALWLTDPAARMAEDTGIMGKLHQNAAELHGAYGQLDNAPIPAWRRGTDRSIVWVNRAYVSAVEASSANVVYKDQIELDGAVRRLAEKAAAEKNAVTGDIVVNVKGERRVFHVMETPTHAGGEAAVNGFAIDVTDLKRTRATLERHIEANRRTLDQIPTAVAMFGVNQELSYYNQAFQSLWELDAAELNARPSHGEVLDRLRNAGRLPEQADYRGWKTEQLALYTEEFATPGVDRTGAAPDDVWPLPDGRTLRVAKARHPLGGVVVVFDDITEQLKFEALHNTQIKVQRATLNNLSEGVATFGADGVLKLHNDAFRDLWRLNEGFLTGRPHIEQVSTKLKAFVAEGVDALALVKRRVTSMSADDRKAVTDQTLSLTDGRTLSFGTEPLPDGATLLYFLDITDSCEREKELKERNAFLEDIDRQKSKFVDHVSYQLRTPLNTIIGFSEMIDGEMFGVLNERQKDYVASVLSAAYSLKDLISDIMDLAAIDAGKFTLEREDVSIRDLLTNAAAYAALKAEDTRISLTVDCPNDIGVVHVDERRLKQVLFNLLSNAFAYTGVGGEVKLCADRAPGLVRIWVADDGRGVSPEDQAKAFEAFESSGPSAGAGLGLALVQRYITLHGGWVRMESAPGAGTRVTLFLPSGARPQRAPSELTGEVVTPLAGDAPSAAPKPGTPEKKDEDVAEGDISPVNAEKTAASSGTNNVSRPRKRIRAKAGVRPQPPRAKAAE